MSTINYEIPLIGICLGSQLIASACGGSIYKGPNKEIGWGQVDITDCGKESVFRNISKNQIQVFHWHGDTFTLPKGAQVLARSDLYIQAFSFKSRGWHSISFRSRQTNGKRLEQSISTRTSKRKSLQSHFCLNKIRNF